MREHKKKPTNSRPGRFPVTSSFRACVLLSLRERKRSVYWLSMNVEGVSKSTVRRWLYSGGETSARVAEACFDALGIKVK